jgi:hypothetical protein
MALLVMTHWQMLASCLDDMLKAKEPPHLVTNNIRPEDPNLE